MKLIVIRAGQEPERSETDECESKGKVVMAAVNDGEMKCFSIE